MEDDSDTNVDWSGGRSIDSDVRCDGTCCDSARWRLGFQVNEWWILDADWNRYIPVTYCPWCGKRLEKV
jgi:hypothetical protein